MKEKIFRLTAFSMALLSIIFLFGIIYTIFKEGMPIFKETGILKFIFGMGYHPTEDIPEYGIFPLIAGSLAVTFGSLIIAIPLGLGSAIYLSELAHRNTRETVKPFIELLASIPSVIYGLFGMAFLAPFVRNIFNLPIGLNLFTASIVLGVMVTPIISSISEDALSSVPHSIKEASFALGANKIETIFHVTLPAASSGVLASILLGFGRAIGETMVVLMIAGGSAIIPKSIFSPVRPMPSTIAAEMGETMIGSSHYHALFGIAIILFFITFISNIIVLRIIRKRMPVL